ncbi:hypothetical protein [Devosia sp.]|uniref:COG3904 family protein n=1 Tax=Devosia sp. TaxID=1871048 RepID=UPI001AD369A8|nr:hypothetical protein [Devosia sp.]MBN9310128.1 hypothetical protein [Devosia sp.]
MRLLTSAIAILSIAMVPALPAVAAEISIVSMHYSATHPVPHLHYEGETVAGDAAALEGLYNSFVNCRESCSGPDGMPTAVLTMNGPGGSYVEGLALADFLREHHIATVVERGAYCYSACAFAFLGGSAWSSQEGMGTYIDRMVEPGSTVGFHAPYADEDSFRAAVEERGGMAAQGQTRDALSLMVKELVKWNVDPEVIFRMVGMGPDETYDLRSAEDLYLARVALPPTPTSGWVSDIPAAVRNACMRLLAIDERGDPADMNWRFLSEYTPNIGKAEYAGALSGYLLGERLLDIGNCSVTEESLATNGDYEIALYFTPGIDGLNGAATSMFNRQAGWSTAGQGRNPTKRILIKGPLNSYFLPLDQDLDSLDLPGEADIDANRFNLAAPPPLPVMPGDFAVDATTSTSRVSHKDNVFVFERVGPRTLFESARDKPLLGRTIGSEASNDISFVRSGTYDDTGISFSWYGILDGDNALVVEALALPSDGAAASDDDLATLRRVGCEFDFNGMKLGCD